MTTQPMDDSLMDSYPKNRMFRLALKRCIMNSCDGELAEVSYYERNNWVTVELQCDQCKRRFVVKVEM